MSNLKGVISVLITPFDESGRIDHTSLSRVLEAEIEAGVHGIVTTGIFSEAYKMSESERRSVIRTVVNDLDGQLPLVAGIDRSSTECAVESAQAAEGLGADCVMVMPPTPFDLDDYDVTEHYVSIAESVSCEVMIQDCPGLTGVAMPLDFYRNLCNSQPNIRYIKIEVEPTWKKIRELCGIGMLHTDVIAGLNAVAFVDELEGGAVGTIPGCGFSRPLVEIYDAFAAGNHDEARRLHNSILPLLRFLGQSPEFSISTGKQLLAQRGVIATPTLRRPRLEYNSRALETLLEILEHIDWKWDKVGVASS